MAKGEGDDRTEAATARHLDQAREEGRVPVSREVATFAGLAAVVLVLGLQSQAMMQRLAPALVVYLSRTGDASMLGAARIRALLIGVAGAVAPSAVAAVVAGAVTVLLQTKFLIHWGGLEPKMSRVNPKAGLSRVFGFNGLVEMVKSLFKLALLSATIWFAIRNDWNGLMQMPAESPSKLLSAVWQPAFHLFIAAVVTQAIVASADLGWVHFRHARDMRMSKQDIRDEMKDTDGNPHIKARMRRMQLMRSRRRMMQKVPTATVVVTNPTHYAVALAYDRVSNPAPRIVAKGADSIAARIREVADANRVPIVANPPLARALYRLDLDTEIPAEHYKAVAEIIAYIWKLRQARQAVS